MKGRRSALLAVLTGLLVIGGAALPWLVSLGQDRYLMTQEEVWMFDPVGLRLGDEPAVWPALCLMAGPHEWLSWDSETNLQRDDVVQAALAAAEAMEKSGLTMPGIARVSEERTDAGAALAVSGDVRGLSAVLWSVFWFSDEEAVCNMFIDDSTGKMVGAVVSTPAFKDLEHLYIQMENWRVFLEDYYGLEIDSIEEFGEEHALYDADTSVNRAGTSLEMEGMERRFALYLDLGEELGERRFLLDLANEVAGFNM